MAVPFAPDVEVEKVEEVEVEELVEVEEER